MNILLACIHYPSASGRFITNALRRLGHHVLTVGPTTGTRIWGLDVPQKFVWTPDLILGNGAMNPDARVQMETILAELKKYAWEPELIITADSAFTLHGEAPCPHILWGVDNHVRDYSLRAWDHKFLAHKHGMRMRDKNTTWLPCAYDPDLHKTHKPFFQRAVHAAMIAVMYEPRQKLMARLAEDETLRLVQGMGPLFEEYVGYYNESLVSLCLSAKRDVAQRIFEGMAMGCVVMSDPCDDFEELGLKDGEHYIEYKDPDEAHQKLRELIDGPPERAKELVEAGQAWVKDQTWDKRCEVVLEIAKEP